MFIPYTGSGVLASAVGMEKVFAKQVFVAPRASPTPAYRVFIRRPRRSRAPRTLPFGSRSW